MSNLSYASTEADGQTMDFLRMKQEC